MCHHRQQQDEGEGDQVLCTLEKGAYFGEMALLLSVQRTANVVAESFCELNSLTQQGYLAVAEKYPDEARRARDRALLDLAGPRICP